MMEGKRWMLITVMATVLWGGVVSAESVAGPRSQVRVVPQDDGSFTLLRNGEPYLVKGAGYSVGVGTTGGSLALLARSGGNSIRTWGVEQLAQEVDGKPLLDRAYELGISVTVGFWVQHVRHGFDYGDPASVAAQRERLRKAVLAYRDHPALLVWGLGNEMERVWEGDENELSDAGIWRELNHMAGIIKSLDPHHPVMTVVDGTPPAKIQAIKAQYPALDILGINAYAGAVGAGQRLRAAGWEGPYMLTEFGVTGTWEVPATPWNAPIEPDPSAKASESYTAYTRDQKANAGRSLGSYVFLWGSKQEATFTWFGMFLPTGEKLPRVDAMAYAWSGRWPANRAPKLLSLQTPVALSSVAPGTLSYAKVECVDREGDSLRYEWEIREESRDRRVGGDAEAVPPTVPNAISRGQGTARIEFAAPRRSGAYRLFVTAFDGHGGAVAHNLPFRVGE